jgi:hypothetical protein
MRGITKTTLEVSHPHIAEALAEVYNTNKKNHYWFFVNYNGKYKTSSGVARKVSFGAIIDVLNDNGYTIDISIRKTTKP